MLSTQLSRARRLPELFEQLNLSGRVEMVVAPSGNELLAPIVSSEPRWRLRVVLIDTGSG